MTGLSFSALALRFAPRLMVEPRFLSGWIARSTLRSRCALWEDAFNPAGFADFQGLGAEDFGATDVADDDVRILAIYDGQAADFVVEHFDEGFAEGFIGMRDNQFGGARFLDGEMVAAGIGGTDDVAAGDDAGELADGVEDQRGLPA